MLRFFNILAVTVLVATAGWAYQTKYETIRYAEEVRKLEGKVEKERDTIAILKAEWQLLNRPGRIEELAQKLELKALKPSQITRVQDLPERGKEVDQIGAKLDQLLTGSISTPNSAKPSSSGTTPGVRTQARTPAKVQAAARSKLLDTPNKTAARPASGTPTRTAASSPPARGPISLTPPAAKPAPPKR